MTIIKTPCRVECRVHKYKDNFWDIVDTEGLSILRVLLQPRSVADYICTAINEHEELKTTIDLQIEWQNIMRPKVVEQQNAIAEQNEALGDIITEWSKIEREKGISLRHPILKAKAIYEKYKAKKE